MFIEQKNIKTNKDRPLTGFTLIEIIVVIAILAVLSTIVMIGVNNARAKARDARRKSEMRNLQKALVMYYAANGAFPSTGGAWWGECSGYGSHPLSGSNGYIPNLDPYITQLPIDPKGHDAGGGSPCNNPGQGCYLYNSDGINYKLLAHCAPESFPAAGQPFYDPLRPTWAWMVCSGDPTACNTW